MTPVFDRTLRIIVLCLDEASMIAMLDPDPGELRTPADPLDPSNSTETVKDLSGKRDPDNPTRPADLAGPPDRVWTVRDPPKLLDSALWDPWLLLNSSAPFDLLTSKAS
jgi:hypothetical protein